MARLDLAGVAGIAAIAGVVLGTADCGRGKGGGETSIATTETTAATTETDDGGAADARAADDGPLLYALAATTPVMSDTTATATVLGYLRFGGSARADAELLPSATCRGGMYELHPRGAGFVCSAYATLDPNHPRLADAPPPPMLDEALPYRYAFNIANGTPLYRWLPSRATRLSYEPWLGERSANVASVPNVTAAFDGDAGGAETPWYLRDWDGGKPQVTLDDLKGDGVLVRRMVKGFYIAIDKPQGGFWKTTSGSFAAQDRMYLAQPPTDFHGVWLGVDSSNVTTPPWPRAIAQEDGGTPAYWVEHPPSKLPLAFVNATKSMRYAIERFVATPTVAIPRYTPVGLSGATVTIGATTYLETLEHDWVRESDAVAVRARPMPSDLAPGERWIDVDLTTQTLVAFEHDVPVYATLVSTGKAKHPTPQGTFHVWEKHVAASMDGDGAKDGPYSIEDVPWIMYFDGGYALHGAFWHSNFGHRQSHGCVNLAPDDARAMFGWTGPHLPPGWHGVTATDANPGTRVVIHD